MRRLLLLAFALLLPSTAMATPWFDQAWAEQLVAEAFPDYWEHIREIEANGNRELYIDRLHQGRVMAMSREHSPELVEAWENRFYAVEVYRDLLRQWKADPQARTDALRRKMIAAAEDFHLATLELFDAQLANAEARGEQLQLQIADYEVNFDIYALETVDKALGPAATD
jgi:hypothetical protein